MIRWILVGLVAVAGCGATKSPVVDDTPLGRVSPELRDACGPVPDDQIATLIVVVQAAKDAGVSETEAVALHLNSCIESCDDNLGCLTECILCTDGVIREVY